jgi:hypothetical protein
MLRLARFLRSARNVAERLQGLDDVRRPRRVTLGVEQLEERLVPTLFGQQIFPSDNAWNQNIANAPLAANSAAVISHIGSAVHLHPDWGADNPANGSSPLYGIPFNVVHGNSTAKINVIIDNYPGESDIAPVPIPANAVVEGDLQNGPNMNGGGYNAGQRGDSHLIIWDEDADTAYELYGVSRPGDPTLFPNTAGVELPKTDGLWHAAQETVWNMKTDEFRTLGATSADAAGLSILAGLVRPDEGLTVAQGGQGAINHALRVTLPPGDVNPQYIYPASHMVSESQASNKVPFGARLRLQNTPAVNAQIAAMPPESQIIARAMQQYGLIVADIGSAMYVTGVSATVDNVDSPNTNLVWDLNDIFASSGLKSLTAGEFDVVDLTPRVTALSASSGSPGSTITITGQNFSGAGGRLSVLFGSTPSTSLTIVDDSHVRALVPSGSGTVNVRVQSGINETDTISSNPNANVTSPIYGYGISAITPADQFTYTQAWKPVDVTIGSDGNTRLLWSQAGGGADVWSVNGSSVAGTSPVYSVANGWSVQATAAGSDGLTRVLWRNTNGSTALWLLNEDGSMRGAGTYTALSGWSPIGMTIGADGNTRILWTNTGGQVAIWSVNNSFGIVGSQVYGPISGWTAESLAAGSNGKIWLMWRNLGGGTALWLLNADGTYNSSTVFAAISGWTAQEIAVGADGNARILWTSSNGALAVWTVSATTFQATSGPVYGPIAGWVAQRLATGADGTIRVLWTNTNGAAALWVLDSNDVFSTSSVFGPL